MNFCVFFDSIMKVEANFVVANSRMHMKLIKLLNYEKNCQTNGCVRTLDARMERPGNG